MRGEVEPAYSTVGSTKKTLGHYPRNVFYLHRTCEFQNHGKGGCGAMDWVLLSALKNPPMTTV